MKGVHVKWSVLRWAEGQSFVLCDPRCKLLYSQGRERVNRSIVHCWITCKCCNYMYICLIFFLYFVFFSFSITFLCCDFVYFWLCTLLKVFLFALVYYHDTFHSLCTVSFCIVYLILFIPSSFRERCHNLSYFFTVSTNIEFDIGHYCDLQNEWLRTPSPLFYLLNVCQFYNEFGNEHLMTSV